MNQNPFASPAPIENPSNSQDGQFQLVSQGTRFVNYLGDGVVQFGVITAASVAAPSAFEGDSIFVSLGFFFAYFVLFEWLIQQTPGKFVTGTKVVDQDGGPPSFGQILGRTASRLIPFEAFSFLSGDAENAVGWHDKLSFTRVVTMARGRRIEKEPLSSEAASRAFRLNLIEKRMSFLRRLASMGPQKRHSDFMLDTIESTPAEYLEKTKSMLGSFAHSATEADVALAGQYMNEIAGLEQTLR